MVLLFSETEGAFNESDIFEIGSNVLHSIGEEMMSIWHKSSFWHFQEVKISGGTCIEMVVRNCNSLEASFQLKLQLIIANR